MPAFVPDALPAELTIAYSLTSAFADGQAEYSWKRDGDRYEISGSLQAVGFFTVFLEGRIDQESSGRVTAGRPAPGPVQRAARRYAARKASRSTGTRARWSSSAATKSAPAR